MKKKYLFAHVKYIFVRQRTIYRKISVSFGGSIPSASLFSYNYSLSVFFFSCQLEIVKKLAELVVYICCYLSNANETDTSSDNFLRTLQDIGCSNIHIARMRTKELPAINSLAVADTQVEVRESSPITKLGSSHWLKLLFYAHRSSQVSADF